MNTRTQSLLALAAALAVAGCTDRNVSLGEMQPIEGEGSAGAAGGDPNAAGSGAMGTCADGSHPVVKADGTVVCSDGSIPGGDGTPGSGGGTDGTPVDPNAPGACGKVMCETGCCSETCSLCAAPDGTCKAVMCDPAQPSACPPGSCGPDLGVMPSICPDGTVAGPMCMADASGLCSWSYQDCPTTPKPQACGSRGLGACPMGQFCFWEAGADCGRADAPGVCADYPTVCTKELHVVCGCDGNTYDNVCLAASQGIGIDYEGPCKPPGDTCGGFVGAGCPTGYYCDYAPPDGQGCLVADGTGVCREQPTICTREYAPVCGCDGTTYGNACQAAAAGVTVAHAGECGTGGGHCGTTTCTDTQFCDRAVGQCDAAGTCMERPQVCETLYKPVCGCDGKTYSLDCVANGAGTSVAHDGQCM